MAIISAGVIMNVIFGILIFIFVFQTHGVERTAANVGVVDPGSRRGAGACVRAEDRTDRQEREAVLSNDLQQRVMLSVQDEEISFAFFDPYRNEHHAIDLKPKRSGGSLTPSLESVPSGGSNSSWSRRATRSF